LEALTTGYSPDEVELSIRLALDRWRTTEQIQLFKPPKLLRFSGSHDLAVDWLAANFALFAPEYSLQLSFSGSLGGLIALAEGKADLAGCHLWDHATDTYNVPFVQRLLPGQKIALITLAYRRQGLIVPPGNPLHILGLADLFNPEVTFINRQPGSGTRVWLDAQLHQMGLDPRKINGYAQECMTHSDVARAIAEERINTGIGLEATAIAFGLGFIFLHREPYQLAIPAENLESGPVQALMDWLQRPTASSSITALGGYDTSCIGDVQIVEN
jgi:putative molybdopterin biosynthesis protein